MIENREQLKHSKEALALLKGARLALKRKMIYRNPGLFHVMARAYLEGEDGIKREIYEYEARR